MITPKIQREFGLTLACDAQVYDKLFNNFRIIKKLMNNSLSIKKYTQVVDRIVFLYMGFRKDDIFHDKETKRINRRKRIMEFGLKLDYDRLLVCSEEEALHMMAQLFLATIPTYPTIRGKVKLSEFDYETFYQDVQALFAQQGWVKDVRQAQG